MPTGTPKTLSYKRARFATQLPVAYRYSLSHYWISREEGGRWQIGLTKFATRMLGEMVDLQIDVEVGASVSSGQILGWIEGFKAISDVFCIGEGQFVGINPVLKERITLVNKDPYGAGWLYQLEGSPDSNCIDVQAYKAVLDKTIDRILEKQHGEEIK
jgi:glycine cleavage system H protein